MTVKELKEAIESYPDNYDVTVDCGPFYDIEDVDIDWNNNKIILYIE